MAEFSFKITSKDPKSRARAGVIKTRYGKIKTPYLVPVATRAHIIALSQKDVSNLKLQALLSNTYHLHFRSPGDKEIKKSGGLHKVMKFNKPIFTDSGGFQALSLGKGKTQNLRKIGFFPKTNDIKETREPSFAKITENGIIFTSVYNEKKKELMTPQSSMKIQSNLDSDIIMAFDQCNAPGETKKETKEVMLRSHRWEVESLKHHDSKQALYGIVHGGIYKDLRQQSAHFINSLPFDGLAIGGYMGKTTEELYEIIDWIIPLLDNRPRHLLGIGRVKDIFEGVSRGIDTFDCVETTRIARHGGLYISPSSGGSIKNKFQLRIAHAIYKKDKKPIDKNCKCSTCKKYSRAELRELFKNEKFTYGRLATIHNLHFMHNLSLNIRKSIETGKFQQMKKQWLNQRHKEKRLHTA